MTPPYRVSTTYQFFRNFSSNTAPESAVPLVPNRCAALYNCCAPRRPCDAPIGQLNRVTNREQCKYQSIQSEIAWIPWWIIHGCEFNVIIINLAQTRTQNVLYGVPDSGLLLQLNRDIGTETAPYCKIVQVGQLHDLLWSLPSGRDSSGIKSRQVKPARRSSNPRQEIKGVDDMGP